jgi:hypothetical protein
MWHNSCPSEWWTEQKTLWESYGKVVFEILTEVDLNYWQDSLEKTINLNALVNSIERTVFISPIDECFGF